ncbi:MAG: phosphoglycolate phosphatase [Campylobacterota bacterium]
MFIEKELLLFDLDGTLIDSAPDLALSVNYMLRTINHNEFSEEVIDSWVGNGAQTLVKRALSGNKTVDENIDSDLFDKSLSIFLEYYKNNLCVKTTPYPDVKTTLQALKSDGYKLAIITNKPFDFIEPILKQLELDNLFELCIGGDSLSEKKPSPLPLQYMCGKFNIKARNTLMIGDSKNDILAAKAANIQSIAVSYGYNYGEDIRVYKPDFTVDNFSGILETLL